MYGYLKITSNVPKNIKNYFKYSYCSLCKALQKHYGALGSLTLSYDVTVLSLFLIKEEVYKPYKKIYCIGGKTFSQNDEIFRKLSSLNIFLFREKIKDNLNDEKKLKNIILHKIFNKTVKKAEKIDPDLSEIVRNQFIEFYNLEKKNLSIEQLSELFANLMLEILKFLNMNEKYNDIILNISRWVYYIDAVDDFEKDCKSGEFNPLKNYINCNKITENEIIILIELYKKIFNPNNLILNKNDYNEVVLRHILYNCIPLTTFYIMRKKRYVLY